MIKELTTISGSVITKEAMSPCTMEVKNDVICNDKGCNLKVCYFRDKIK